MNLSYALGKAFKVLRVYENSGTWERGDNVDVKVNIGWGQKKQL